LIHFRADWLFIIPASIVFFSALFVTAFDFVIVQGAVFRFDLASLAGLVFGMISGASRVQPRKTLDSNYSYVLRTSQEHRLVMSNVYRHVRHPICMGAFFGYFAMPLFFHSLCGFVIMALLIPCLLYRKRVEERFLV